MKMQFTQKTLNVLSETIKIERHPDLHENILEPREEARIAGRMTFKEFNAHNRPKLYEVGPDSYLLIGGEWIHDHLIAQCKAEDGQENNRHREICYDVYHDKDLIPAVIRHDLRFMKMLKWGNTALAEQSKVTGYRKDEMSGKRICPVCGKYPIVYAKSDQKPDSNGLYKIICFNNSQGRCCFEAWVTKYQYDLLFPGRLRRGRR